MRVKTEHLVKLKEQALLLGGADKIEILKKRGKLSARERISLLFDESTFEEIDMLVQNRNLSESQKFFGDGVVCGFGKVRGRKTFAFAHDFSAFGGSLAEAHARKITKVMDLAESVKAPIVGLNDSGGARIQEGIVSLGGYADIFFRNTRMSGRVPQVSAILGSCAGGAVYSPALTDFIVMKKDSAMFITGPKVLKSVCGEDVSIEELGGANVHSKQSGVASRVVETEEAAIEEIKNFLSFLPQNCEELPERIMGKPPLREHQEVADVIPDSDRRTYDVKLIIKGLVDGSEFTELQASYAQNIVTTLARIDGRSVGIVANQPKYCAGALDVNASRKAARFIRMCDSFNIPLLTLVDVPGFLPGRRQEESGIIHHGAKLLYAYSEAQVPKITVILRKAYGGAYCVMSSKNLGADVNLAWPTAEIAVMGTQGAKEVLADVSVADITSTGPYQAAKLGFLDDVISPNATRDKLCCYLEMLEGKIDFRTKQRHGNIPL